MSRKLALVTVVYNSPEVLEGFFASLAIQTFQDFELHILDNSPSRVSYDECQRLIAQHAMNNVHLVYNNANLGVAAGNNQGIRAGMASGCEYILLLNNDIEFKRPDFLAALVTEADQRQESMMTAKMYYFDSGRVWCAGGKISCWRGLTTHTGENQVDGPAYSVAGYTAFAPTCFLLVHRRVFEKVGIMDEKYFVYFDDTDFIYRTGKAGYRIYYDPEFKIWHKVSSSTGGAESPITVYYGNRNRIYFIRKNFPPIWQVVSLGYFLATRIVRYLRYPPAFRARLRQALGDGVRMQGFR